MNFAKPLDAIIEKFEYNSLNMDLPTSDKLITIKNSTDSNSTALPATIIDDLVKNWIDTVERKNLAYFESSGDDNQTAQEKWRAANMLSQSSRDSYLYDTSLIYMISVIQKFAYNYPDEGENRTSLYEKYQELEVRLVERINNAKEYNWIDEIKHNQVALNNTRRNVQYHFKSKDVKLFIESDFNGQEMQMHNLTRIPLYIHMASAILCMSMSTIFHWLSCWNEQTNSFLSRLDYGGISFLIAGSCMPPYFYSFYCHETIKFAYGYSILIFSI